jgi:hypothetical protein
LTLGYEMNTCALASLISVIVGIMVGSKIGMGDPKHPYVFGAIVCGLIGFLCGFGVSCIMSYIENRLTFTANASHDCPVKSH